MNDKSRNIHTPCGPHALGNLSNDEFRKDYYKLVKAYLDDDFSAKISRVSSVDDLKSTAEKEFNSYYGSYPTCAVFAPGSLTVAGKNTNLVESKSLSMAVQLVTLIVGKRSHGSKWCSVKTLSDEIVGSKVHDIRLNDESLDLSVEKTAWLRYVKGTILSFKARRAHVPGFKIVIASNVPMKRGLGSSSALVVALYTFLEEITNTYTGNVLDKILACHLAEELAAYPCEVRIGDILTSIVGRTDKIFTFNARSLDIETYDWYSMDVDFVFIECDDGETSKPCTNKDKSEALTLLNTKSRWRTHPHGDSMIELLFSDETVDAIKDIVDENERIERMIDKIESGRWEQLGKLMGENPRSIRKYPDNIERIINGLKSVEGVLGSGIIDRDYGASIVTLVKKSKLKNFISFWNRTKMSQQQCYIMKSYTGASTIYSYERRFLPSSNGKDCRKFLSKYYLKRTDDDEYCNKFESTRTLQLFIPQRSYAD